MTHISTHTIQDDAGCNHSILYYSCDLCGSELSGLGPRIVLHNKDICAQCSIDVTIELASSQGAGMGGKMMLRHIFMGLLDQYLIERNNLRGRHVSRPLRRKILERDKMCCFCGTNEHLHIDHIKPWSKGGDTVEDNLQVLCRVCNAKKGDKYPYKP